jgi:hypothetical protein
MDPAAQPPPLRRVLKVAARVLFGVVLAGMAVWSTMAIYYSNLPAGWLRSLAAVVFALGLVAVFLRMRLWRVACLVFLAAFGAVVLWFLFTPPSNIREWQADAAALPYADIHGDTVTR